MGGQYSTCENSLTNANASIKEIKKQLIENDSNTCAANLATIDAKIKSIQNHFASSNNPPSCNQLLNIQNQTALLSGQLATAGESCANNMSSIQNYSSQLSINSNTYANSYSALSDKLTTTTHSYNQIISSLQNQITTTESHYNQLLSSNSDVSSCSKSLTSENNNISSLNTKIHNASIAKPVTNCTTLINNAQITYNTKKNNLQSQLNTIKNATTDLNNKLNNISASNINLSTQIDQQTNLISSLKSNIKNSNNNLSIANTQIANTNTQIANANSAIITTTNLNNSLKDKYRNLQNTINDFQISSNILKNDNTQLNLLLTIAKIILSLQKIATELTFLASSNGTIGVEKLQLLLLWASINSFYNLPPVWVHWYAIEIARIALMANEISNIFNNLYTANNIIINTINILISILKNYFSGTYESDIQHLISQLNSAQQYLTTAQSISNGNASKWAAYLSSPNGPNNGAVCAQVEFVGHTYPLGNGYKTPSGASSFLLSKSSITLVNTINTNISNQIGSLSTAITNLQGIQYSSYNNSSMSTLTAAPNLYKFIGTYKDNEPRAIPIGVNNNLPNMKPTSVQDAINIAASLGATVFGIQAGNMNDAQIWYTKNPNIQSAVAEATKYGKTTCSNSLGCGYVNQVYVIQNQQTIMPKATPTYAFVGTYKDNGARAIPIQGNNVSSVQDAISLAISLNATVFGIQDGGQFFYTKSPKTSALAEATKYGNTNCSNPLGCGWVNQVYVLTN